MPPKPATTRFGNELDSSLPDLRNDQSLVEFVRNLSRHIDDLIDTPRSFEHLRAEFNLISYLVEYLFYRCADQPLVVPALMILKWHYTSADLDDLGLSSTRGFACEIVAWRFLGCVRDHQRMRQLLGELPGPQPRQDPGGPFGSDLRADCSSQGLERDSEALLGGSSVDLHQDDNAGPGSYRIAEETTYEDELVLPFLGWNALEIATVADAKKFLSQETVQDFVTAVWNGDIIFWDSLRIDTKKRPQYYDCRKSASIYSRLRVPKYVKTFEAMFFASFLVLYYVVLLERAPMHITAAEILLYIWIAAFAYDEFGGYRDVGSRFYAVDMWNMTDLGILLIAVAFLVLRITGLLRQDPHILDISMDIFSLEALLLVPRICALLSLHPFFGTLLPCLKKMSWDFINFLGPVLILCLGFLTTFAMLARDTFSPGEIAWYLIYVFFGSSYLGFNIASEISEVLGPPLMIIFVCLTNILLITSLISLMSNTLDKVMDHAREEYLFQYSVFVLEASASRRLTYYFPPFNLVPLILIRPLRLFLRGDQIRGLRIRLLKIHLPYVAFVWFYERGTLLYRQAAGLRPTPNIRAVPARPRTPRKAYPASRVPPRQSPGHRALSSKDEEYLVRTPAGERDPHTLRLSTEMEELRRMMADLGEQVRELSTKIDRNS